MKSLIIEKPDIVSVQESPVPDPAPDEVLIQVELCGICGTDIHIFEGEYLGKYPVVPGHEFAGTVQKTGSEVTGFKQGDRVAVEPNISCGVCPLCRKGRNNFCTGWQGIGVTRPGGMAEYAIAPESAVFSISDLAFEQAVFMEPLSCVLHGLGKLSLEQDMSAFIAGAGPIGILLLQGLRTYGVNVTVGEPSPERRIHAEQAGASAVFENTETAAETAPYDIAVDATGIPSVMEKLIPLVGKGGEILFFGVPPAGGTVAVPAFRMFEYGLSFHSSYTSVNRSEEAVHLLAEGSINTSRLLTHTVGLDEFKKGIDLIRNSAVSGAMKVAVRP